MLNIWYANDLPYGPRPILARAHMGQGPYGPQAPGPRALPCWANTSPENAPKKMFKLCYFCFDFKNIKKMRNVRTIILAAVSRRDLCYVSENKGFRFAKNKLIHAESSFIAHRSRAHFCFMKFIPINVLVPFFGINARLLRDPVSICLLGDVVSAKVLR